MGGCAGSLSFAHDLRARRHLPTFRCTSTASFCTTLTVLHPVLRTLFCTSITHFGTGITDYVCKFAVARHVTCRQTAKLRAVRIQLDAVRHFLHILFTQTRSCAMVASGGAGITFVDTGLILFMSHDFSHLMLIMLTIKLL
jgi:hypothetical protein